MLRGLVLILGVIALLLGILIVLSVLAGKELPVIGFAIALLGVGEVVQALDGRTP